MVMLPLLLRVTVYFTNTSRSFMKNGASIMLRKTPEGLALNAVVNPFGMVGCIAENVDALFYRCVNLKLAFYLIVLAVFADAVIYRGVAVTVVPFALGVCAKGYEHCNYCNNMLKEQPIVYH